MIFKYSLYNWFLQRAFKYVHLFCSWTQSASLGILYLLKQTTLKTLQGKYFLLPGNLKTKEGLNSYSIFYLINTSRKATKNKRYLKIIGCWDRLTSRLSSRLTLGLLWPLAFLRAGVSVRVGGRCWTAWQNRHSSNATQPLACWRCGGLLFQQCDSCCHHRPATYHFNTL